VELNKIIDGFYTKTTQKEGFSKLCVKKKDVIPTWHNSVSWIPSTTKAIYESVEMVTVFAKKNKTSSSLF
jgi:hypothetical protein